MRKLLHRKLLHRKLLHRLTVKTLHKDVFLEMCIFKTKVYNFVPTYIHTYTDDVCGTILYLYTRMTCVVPEPLRRRTVKVLQ